MTYAAVATFLAVAVALFAARLPMASLQSNVMGGRITPGCVVAEAAIILLLAVVFFLFRGVLG